MGNICCYSGADWHTRKGSNLLGKRRCRLPKNCLIIVSEYLHPYKQIHIQLVSRLFYQEIIPVIMMWRQKIFAKTINTIVHFFQPGCKDVFLYDFRS